MTTKNQEATLILNLNTMKRDIYNNPADGPPEFTPPEAYPKGQ